MSHSHSTPSAPRSEEDLARRRRALRMMIIALIPIGVWTLGALIVMWPSNLQSHITPGISTYSVPGATIETGKIIELAEINCEGQSGSSSNAPNQTCGKARVELTSGPEEGQPIDEVTMKASDYSSGAKVGQTVRLWRIPAEGAPPQYQFNGFERSTPMLVFTALFAIAVIAVARLRGLLSLVGLGFAAFILVKFMFPALVSGSNPTLVGLVGGTAIMFVVLYTAHGFSARTTTALLGTLFGLFAAAGLGYIATTWAHFTGVTSEDDFILQASAPELKLTSVVICGIMVAGLGVLNDVTITQASAVWELAEADPDGRRLFRRAMRIGRDHIASTVYTIAFATAGATLGTMLLLSIFQRPLAEVIQDEQFAQEIIRTLVGSIGLVLAVPLTTVIGVGVVSASKKSRGEISMATDGPTTGPGDELIDRDRYQR